MNVSVIIPAHNAAKTISETLESLRTQTHQGWEAFVIDDGSSDETAAIATSFVEKDFRVHTISQLQMGVCAARNTGIRLANFDWLLFLDADDWLLPLHLERLTGKLISNPNLDAVYCDWARIASDGTRVSEEFCYLSGDMFPTFACRAVFPIHACVVRRSIVESVGGFDTSFRTCEEWDLWQRIARTGAQFGVISEVFALYRMQPVSTSMDGFQMLADGLRVLEQGHSHDTRVQNPHPAHVNGLPKEQLISQKFYLSCWCAGLILGCEKDARPLLRALKDNRYPQLDPSGVARNIFLAALLPTCQAPSAWVQLWPRIEQCVNEFLLALEEQSKAPGLYRRTRAVLGRLILKNSPSSRSQTVGMIHEVCVEITEPLCDINPPNPRSSYPKLPRMFYGMLVVLTVAVISKTLLPTDFRSSCTIALHQTAHLRLLVIG